jgi:hypothetical protein
MTYRGCQSSITPHACLVCLQTYKVFLLSARLTYLLYGYENWRPFEKLEPATILSGDAQTAGWIYL